MKNLKLMVAVVTLAFLSLSFTNTKETHEQLHKQIVELIGDSSETLAKVNSKAEITFTLNEKSELVVLSVKSDNDLVDSFVKTKLNYKKVTVKVLNPGEIYRVPFIVKS